MKEVAERFLHLEELDDATEVVECLVRGEAKR
jgi:hypothetical protein